MSTPYEPSTHGWRTFLIMWSTQAVSVMGTALTLFAINIWLTQSRYPLPEQRPQLAAALSAVNLAFMIPALAFAPLAGAWADRHDRKRIMMLMDLGSGMLSVLLAALLLTHGLQLWMLACIAALAAIFGTFHGSAFDTSYAMLVPEHLLPRANGMMQTVWSLSGILSPAIAAAIIALPGFARQGALGHALSTTLGGLTDGTALAVVIDAVTFLLAAAALLFLTVPSPKRTDLAASASGAKKSIWADVREGALYIWHRRPLLWLLGTFTVANFVSAPEQVLIPLLLKFNLSGDLAAHGVTFEAGLALMGTVVGVGGTLGGLAISAWGGLKSRRVYGVVIPMMLGGIAQIVFGLSPRLYLTAGAAFLGVAVVPVMNAHSQAIWQAQTPHGLQGRVFAVRRVIAQFSGPLAVVLSGWIAGVFNPGWVIAALGVFSTLFCVAQLFNPHMLKVEDRTALDRMAAKAAAD